MVCLCCAGLCLGASDAMLDATASAEPAPPPALLHVRPAVGGPHTEFSFTWLYYPVCGPCAPEQLNLYGPPGMPCHGYYRETPFLQYNVGAGLGGHIRSFFGPHPGQGQLPPRRRTWCPGLYRGEITSGDPESFTPSPYVEYVFTFRIKATR